MPGTVQVATTVEPSRPPDRQPVASAPSKPVIANPQDVYLDATGNRVHDVLPDGCPTMAVVQKMLGNVTNKQAFFRQCADNLNFFFDNVVGALGMEKPKRTYMAGDVEGRRQNNVMPLIANLDPAQPRPGAPFELVGDVNSPEAYLRRTTGYNAGDVGLLFLGDLGDRGDMTIRMRRWLVRLQDDNPGVAWVTGNREWSRLAILNDIVQRDLINDPTYSRWLVQHKLTDEQRATLATSRPSDAAVTEADLEAIRKFGLDNEANRAQFAISVASANEAIRDNPNAYSAWLLKRNPEADNLAKFDTLDNQLEYWLQEHSAKGALEQHRQELEILCGQKVSVGDAAIDYLGSWKPGGEAFEFLARGVIALSGQMPQGKDVLAPFQAAFHGGSSKYNIGKVPHSTERLSEPHAWIAAYAKECQGLIGDVRAAWAENRPLPREALEIGESTWDGAHLVNHANLISPVYGVRIEVLDRVFGSFDIESEDFFLNGRVGMEINGHTPVGNAPVATQSAYGAWRIYTDTSFDFIGSEAVTARVGDLTLSVFRIGKPENAQLGVWIVKPGMDTPIGTITDDGFTVRSVTFDADGKMAYDLYRYRGFDLENKVVTADALTALHPKAITVKESAAMRAELEQWKQKSLADPTYDFKFTEEEVENHLRPLVEQHGFPIVVHGWTKYGGMPGTPKEQEELLASLMTVYGSHPMGEGGACVARDQTPSPRDGRAYVAPPETVVGIMRLGRQAIERIADEQLRNRLLEAAQGMWCSERPLPTFSMVPIGTPLSYIPLNRTVLLSPGAGVRKWDDAIVSNMAVAARYKGAAVFIGGGGNVDSGIARSIALGDVQVFLIAPKDTVKLGALEGDGGASTKWAEIVAKARQTDPHAYPNCHIVKIGENLGARMKAVMEPERP